MKLRAFPMTLAEANDFIAEHHRHSRPVVGGRFAIGCGNDETGLQGVAVVSRPVARQLQDGRTAEVTRCCVDTAKAQKGACSFLYAACWRAWRAMGGERLVTYTLAKESGASLRGAGWQVVAEVEPRDNPWQGPDRAREWHPTYGQLKLRWEANEGVQ